MSRYEVTRNHDWGQTPNPVLRGAASPELIEQMLDRTQKDLANYRRQAFGSHQVDNLDAPCTDRQWTAYTHLTGAQLLGREPRQTWTRGTLAAEIRRLQRNRM